MRNMTKRRRALMNSIKRSVLPDEYQEVEYLKGTGTQYCSIPFNIGVSDVFHGIKGDVEIVENYPQLTIFSENEDQSSIDWRMWGVEITSTRCNVGLVRTGTGSSTKYIYVDLTRNIHFEINSDSVVINNYSQSFSFVNTDYAGQHTMVGRSSSASPPYYRISNQNVRIKKLSFYENDTLVCELIPCYRKSDNKAGFYLTNPPSGYTNFITNSGTGSDWVTGSPI